jgi:hypothetical protein
MEFNAGDRVRLTQDAPEGTPAYEAGLREGLEGVVHEKQGFDALFGNPNNVRVVFEGDPDGFLVPVVALELAEQAAEAVTA